VRAPAGRRCRAGPRRSEGAGAGRSGLWGPDDVDDLAVPVDLPAFGSGWRHDYGCSEPRVVLRAAPDAW